MMVTPIDSIANNGAIYNLKLMLSIKLKDSSLCVHDRICHVYKYIDIFACFIIIKFPLIPQ